MAKRLTEEMVIARTKISDLSKIKRLNCWGSELVDVSLLRRIPNVEVLSLRLAQSPQRRPEQRRSYSPDEQCVERRRNSFDREAPRQPATQYYDTSSSATNSFEEPKSCDSQNTYREAKIVTSQSASCIKEYTNGDRYIQTQQYKESSEVSSTHGLDKRYSCSAAVHRPPFTRRPVTRNSNILSAVLCLVKELDYPSLEVVEMAVRCRMDELDE
ncbi:hypothetical protein HUJ04_004594 [Dendroctonus ponderosae]|nr:hypothetical protein HUJ04_004594 [Dendroctonus ponderosae]